MKQLVCTTCIVLFGYFGSTIPASAQSVGTIAVTAAALAMHASAPKWWSWDLPEKTGTLKASQPVMVLNELSHNTLFGQDKWFLVRNICEDDSNSGSGNNNCEEEIGWVLGSDNGQPLLTPEPPN